MPKRRIERSDVDPIPLHRSYGITKRETWVTHLNNLLASVLAVILIVTLATVWIVGIVLLISMMGYLGIFLAMIACIVLIYLIPMRKLRKRIRFLFRLRRTCRKYGFKLEFKRNFFKAMRFNKQGLDFTVDTGKKIWCVRFFTTPKYLSHITFVDKKTVDIKTGIVKSRLKFVLGTNRTKVKRIEYTFDDCVTSENKKAEKAILLNPVPHDVFKKDRDGAVIPIGTGERIHGYTVFSGTGFLENLRREA